MNDNFSIDILSGAGTIRERGVSAVVTSWPEARHVQAWHRRPPMSVTCINDVMIRTFVREYQHLTREHAPMVTKQKQKKVRRLLANFFSFLSPHAAFLVRLNILEIQCTYSSTTRETLLNKENRGTEHFFRRTDIRSYLWFDVYCSTGTKHLWMTARKKKKNTRTHNCLCNYKFIA